MQSSQQENHQEQENPQDHAPSNAGSCLFNKSGVTVMGVFVPWMTVVIVALILIWFLNRNGYFNAEVVSVMGAASAQMPAQASVGVSANVQANPSMPTGDVAKFFNHDLW